MVHLPSGRSFGDLFVGLHVQDALQSALLFLPPLLRLRPARLRFDVLLRGHFSVYRPLFQGDDPSDYDQRRQSVVQQDDRVLPQEAQADRRPHGADHSVTGHALLHGLDALRHRQFDRPVWSGRRERGSEEALADGDSHPCIPGQNGHCV